MYKLTVPIDIDSFNEETLPIYLEQLKDIKADRVYLCCGAAFIYDDAPIITQPEKAQMLIDTFKENGFEAGIWISSLGHGCLLPGASLSEKASTFRNMKGANGGECEHGFCPSDEKFRQAYGEGLKKLASYNPDIIQLDDDFRLNSRGGVILACFCDEHLKDYYRRIGEELPLEEIRKRILTGGNNKYRTAYMEMCRETLLDCAKYFRSCIDEVNPNIRFASCGTHENWDASGTDMIEIAKAFAGNTKPFMRTNAGPYWHNGFTYKTLIDIIEFNRMQANWCKGTGIEVYAEGDTFPRPVINKSSSILELFDLTLLATNELDGDLKYMFDFLQKPDYETGYIDAHIRNENLRNSLSEIFEGKKAVGPRIFVEMHTAKDRDYSHDEIEAIYSLKDDYRYLAFLPTNSIPTTFNNDSKYPVLVVGENAKYVTEKDLENGAILDIKAAEILQNRGFDTGLLSAEKTKVAEEIYSRHNDYVNNVDSGEMYKISVKDNVEILSTFKNTNTPSSYIYGKFAVFAVDMTYSYENRDFCTKNYFFSYYRQEDLMYIIEKLSGEVLPVKSKKHHMLYTLASKDETSMAVALSNIFEDGVYNGKFELDKDYKEIKFINCTGRLDGNIVTIDEITPFGFVAFEVR